MMNVTETLLAIQPHLGEAYRILKSNFDEFYEADLENEFGQMEDLMAQIEDLFYECITKSEAETDDNYVDELIDRRREENDEL